jgi:ZIP family zinc transporter
MEGVQQMVDFFLNLDPVIQTIIASLFTWGMTALGASCISIYNQNIQ